MDHKTVSSRGGKATYKRYGADFYSRIGKLGAKSKLKTYGPEYFKRLAKMGTEARRKQAIDNTSGGSVE